MLDVESQIQRLAEGRAATVPPFDSEQLERGATPLRDRRPRWPRRHGAWVLAAAAFVLIAVVGGIALTDDEEPGTDITTDISTTVPVPSSQPSTTTASPSTTVPVAIGFIAPTSGPPGTAFTGRTTVPDSSSNPSQPLSYELWFVPLEPSDAERTSSARVGTMTVQPTGDVEFSGAVPQVTASAPADSFALAEVAAMAPGRYRLATDPRIGPTQEDTWGLHAIEFEVTALGAGLPATGAGGRVPDPAKALLGPGDLAGVPLGSGAATAADALTLRFGEPDSDSGWMPSCLTTRTLVWGGLTATFYGGGTARDDIAAGDFSWYRYDLSAGSTTDLETTSGVRLGTGLAELIAREPGLRFRTGYDSQIISQWWRADGSSGGLLSRDVTSADTVVTSIGAGTPDGNVYGVC